MNSQASNNASYFKLSSLNISSNGTWLYPANNFSGSAVDAVTEQDLPFFKKLSLHDQYRITKVNYCWVPSLLSLDKPLDKMIACEIGCGIGTVSVPLSRLFKHYYAIDIDKGRLDIAINNAKTQARDNITFLNIDAVSFLNQFKNEVEKVDVFILFAVLEHLTIAERKVMLSELAALLKGKGILLIAEAPNRLFYFDSHSSQMNFFELLPDELAIEYYKKSPRKELISTLENSDNKTEALYRFGRGVSYHEFELWLPDRWSNHIVVDGYNQYLTADNPYSWYEAFLNGYFINHGLLLNRSFSRYWLDFICDFSINNSNHSSTSNPIFITPELNGKGSSFQAKEWWQSPGCAINDRHSSVTYELPKDSNRVKKLSLMFNWDKTKGMVNIEVEFQSRNKCVIPYDFNLLNSVRPKFWHNHGFLTIRSSDKDIRRISIKPDSRGSLFCGNYLLA